MDINEYRATLSRLGIHHLCIVLHRFFNAGRWALIPDSETSMQTDRALNKEYGLATESDIIRRPSAKRLIVTLGGYSSAGPKDENQDAFAACITTQEHYKGVALCVADGVSCSEHAQQASTTSVTHFLQDYYSTPDSWDVKTAAGRVLSSLNAWLYHHGQQASARLRY